MTLRKIEEALRGAGIDNARAEALILAEHFANIPRSHLLMMTDNIESPQLDEAVKRRMTREPLQYIVGTWSFMGLDFAVSPDCLIPRADTETLAEYAAANIRHGGVFADLCTGSGCIAISVLNCRGDLTASAVEIARRNRDAHYITSRLSLICGDVCGDVFKRDEYFDAILSNPPYVTAGEIESLDPELSFEPLHALTDGADGLSIIRAILEIYPAHLEKDGFMAIEFGAAQAAAVSRIAASNGLSCEILKDIAGHERVAVCRRQ